MIAPEYLVEEQDIPERLEKLPHEAVGEMEMEVGDMYFKKGHSHRVLQITPEDDTFRIAHSDGEEKDKSILREYRHWRAGRVIPVSKQFTMNVGDV